MIQVFAAVIAGILCGCFTGLTPGIHINLLSVILVSLSSFLLAYTSPVVLAVFIIAMAVTHTFCDSVPSIFLGAPSADTVLSVLPGHRMLLQGMGYEAVKLTVIGSLLSLLLVIMLIPLAIKFIPVIYEFIKPYMGFVIVLVAVLMITQESSVKKMAWGAFIFLLAGLLGMIVLDFPGLEQPLLPMLSGLFGTSVLILSLSDNQEIPPQRITDMVQLSSSKKVKAIGSAVFSGSLTGLFPGVGSASAALVSTSIVGNIGMHGFLVLVGGINTVNFVFSLAALYTIEKARNGAVVAVLQLMDSTTLAQLSIFLFAALLAGGAAAFLALFFAKYFSRWLTKVDYGTICSIIIILILLITVFFTGFYGLIILAASTALGMLPQLTGTKRSNAMGCIMLPVAMFFLG